MSIFWQEFFHFITNIFGVLVFISAGALFLQATVSEKRLKTLWRGLGFMFLAGAFLFFIIERKLGYFGLVGLTIEAIAAYAILLGIIIEPSLVELSESGKAVTAQKGAFRKALRHSFDIIKNGILAVISAIVLILIVGFIFGLGAYAASAFEALIFVIFAAIFILQFLRLRRERGIARHLHMQNVYPLLGIFFLALRTAFFFFHRLPEPEIVALRQLTLQFSSNWQLGVLMSFLAFLVLAIWIWRFVRIRPFLRTFVILLTLAILVSTIGSLIFSSLIFQIVEKDNLDQMMKGANTQTMVIQDRSQTASFIAKTIANDKEFIAAVRTSNSQKIKELGNEYLKDAEIDIFRVFNSASQIIASPSDDRDQGRVLDNDPLLKSAITKKAHIKTFDFEPGVLASMIVARSIYPLMDGSSLIGAVEIGYKFDNAFVDFSKDRTNLDVTFYTGSKRSATTIRAQDNVSRWVGTNETDNRVLSNVLERGHSYSTLTDRLGEIYYSAYNPIKNINGEIIGMVSVGSPANILIDNTRQRLISTFLILTILSIISSWGAYKILKKYHI